MNEYPSEEQLKGLREVDSFRLNLSEIVDLIREAWNEDYGKIEFDDRKLILACGGWSGNEDVVCALQDNIGFRRRYWVKTERGGRYIFDGRCKIE